MFDTDPDVVRGVAIIENSDFADWHRAGAVTRANAIFVRGSGRDFLANPELTLHEYYHVLRQWNTGELTAFRYLCEWLRRRCRYDRICYEIAARDFAARNVERYRSLLATG